MFEENEIVDIRELRNLFELAKNAPRDEEGDFVDLEFGFNVLCALDIVGSERLFELKDEVIPYLNDVHPDFRAEAIKSLGWNIRLHMPEFKEKAHEMWLHDEDENVRDAALTAWYAYNQNTKNPKVLEELYNVLISTKYSIFTRGNAYYGIFDVAEAFIGYQEKNHIMSSHPDSEEEFYEFINWDKLHRIMKENVPGWLENKL